PNVLVPRLLRLRVAQGKPKLVDHLGPEPDRLLPAIRARVLEDLLAKIISERRLLEPRSDAAVLFAEDLALADREVGAGLLEIGNRRAQVLEHLAHFIFRKHLAAAVGDLDSFGERLDRVVAVAGL